MSKVKVTTHNNITGVVGYLHSCECWLLLVGPSDRAEILHEYGGLLPVNLVPS